MRLAALFSGGKDSTFAVYKAMKKGYKITHLVTALPENTASYMFQHQNVHWCALSAQALDIPWVSVPTKGIKEQEVRDIEAIIATLDVDGLLVGAVESDYQMRRAEIICERLSLASVAPLWHQDQLTLLKEFISSGFKAKVVGVAAQGLDATMLGRTLDEDLLSMLLNLRDEYGISIYGEGGEYETFVVDGPIFKKKIVVDKSNVVWDGVRGEYIIEKAHLEDKDGYS